MFVCFYWFIDGCCIEIMRGANRREVLSEKHCHLLQDILKMKDEDVFESWYLFTKLNAVKSTNSMTLIFTAMVNLNTSCCFALILVACELNTASLHTDRP
jgi:hypothetical protein